MDADTDRLLSVEPTGSASHVSTSNTSTLQSNLSDPFGMPFHYFTCNITWVHSNTTPFPACYCGPTIARVYLDISYALNFVGRHETQWPHFCITTPMHHLIPLRSRHGQWSSSLRRNCPSCLPTPWVSRLLLSKAFQTLTPALLPQALFFPVTYIILLRLYITVVCSSSNSAYCRIRCPNG